MKPVSVKDIEKMLQAAGVSSTDYINDDSRLLELSKTTRYLKVWVGEGYTPAFVAEILSLVLQLDTSWLLLPRFGDASELGFAEVGEGARAIAFDVPDYPFLADYLSTYPHARAVYSDLWLVGGTGNVLFSWDHHAAPDGLDVSLRLVADASRLLVSLNELGAEIEKVVASD